MTRSGERGYRSGEYALTPDQARDIVAKCPDAEEAALLALAIATGMRRADIVRVKVSDLDLESGKVSYLEGKKDDRIMTVNVPESVAAIVERWLRTRDTRSSYLFPARNSLSKSGHLSPKTAYNIFQRNMDARGFKDPDDTVPFHALRATCVKLAQARGWSDQEIAEHIGDQVHTIQKHYATPSKAEMEEVAREKPLL